MPELPEVESAVRLVTAECGGKRIVKVTATEQGGGPRDGLFDDSVIEDVANAGTLSAALVNRHLTAVHRKGKQQYWLLSGPGPNVLLHFGMSGSISVLRPGAKPSERLAASYKSGAVDASQWPPRYCKLELIFDDGTRLAYTDPRRFGSLSLVAGDPLESPKLAALGPDAFHDLPSATDFAALLQKQSGPIKALLLDQSFVAGIGNWIAGAYITLQRGCLLGGAQHSNTPTIFPLQWFAKSSHISATLADEVLYTAKLHPASPASALDADDAARLHAAIKSVLELAVRVDADYKQFPDNWLFHVRWDKGKGAVSTRLGERVTFVTVGGRTSAVVLKVQRLLRGGNAARNVKRGRDRDDGEALVGTASSGAVAEVARPVTRQRKSAKA